MAIIQWHMRFISVQLNTKTVVPTVLVRITDSQEDGPHTLGTAALRQFMLVIKYT